MSGHPLEGPHPPAWGRRRDRIVTSGWEATGLEVLGEADFDGSHLRRDGLYAVCFAATWCLPTRWFLPKFIAHDSAPGVQRVLADITDLKSPLWDTFQIRITPSLLVFRGGEVRGRLDGRRVVGLRTADLEKLDRLALHLAGPVPTSPALGVRG